MKRLRSVCSSMLASAVGPVKLGQPVPESNFASDEKSTTPQPAQRYMPSFFVCTYPPVNGGSVPLRRSTSYCAGVSSSRHCLSVLSVFVLIFPPDPVSLRGTRRRRKRFIRNQAG